MKKNVQLCIYEFHASSAAISLDHDIKFACHEDRIVKKKNEIGFPLLSIKKCLEFTNLKPSDVDEFAIVNDYTSYKSYDAVVNYLFKRQSRYSVTDWIEENEKYWFPKLYKNKNIKSYFHVMGGYKRIQKDHYLDLSFYNEKKSLDFNIKKLFNEKIRLIKKLGFINSKIIFLPHYKCHHYHSYYSSNIRNFNNTIIAHAEGNGGKFNQAVSIPTKKGIKFIHGTNKFNLGRLYQWTTLNLKMLPYHDEYKLMGLSPYSNNLFSSKLLKILQNYFRVNPKKLIIEFKKKPIDMYFYFQKIFQNFRFDIIASSVQELLEINLVEWIKKINKKYKKRNNLFYGGGVAMNVKANLLISNIKGIKNFFIPISPADESNVIGGLYYLIERSYLKKRISLSRVKPLASPYLGMQYKNISNNEIRKVLKNISITSVNEKNIAKLLLKGKIIGRFFGRAEFGQRALGNRSILASPLIHEITNKLNTNIKSRDFWMPFAMTVLDKYEKKYFEKNTFRKSIYMTTCFKLKSNYHNVFKCGVHPADFTVRAQILNRKLNNEYYNLIESFARLSKFGALVNTSFNVHKKPIIETPLDALNVLKNTNLDGLILNDKFILKK